MMSSNESVCPSPDLELLGYHYDDLKNEDDHYEDYAFWYCPSAQEVEYFQYDEAETFQSNYQLLNFVTREEDRDVCLNLETTLQICSSYRPHYHEFIVSLTCMWKKLVFSISFLSLTYHCSTLIGTYSSSIHGKDRKGDFHWWW